MSANPFALTGRRVLVTGASSGIGRQVAIGCAEMGATVVLTGRDVTRLEETRDRLGSGEHVVLPADLMQTDAVERIVSGTGAVDGVVHAAGIARMVPFRMMRADHVDEVLHVNTKTPLLLTSALLAKRAIRPGGSIVFVGAVASVTGPVATAAYSASKAALLGGARSLAVEVAKHRIRANVVAPGYVRTPMLDELQRSGANFDDFGTPLGIGEPDDVAHAVIFLLADASRWISRSLFIVDGGLTTRLSI